jgi:carboxylesterase
MAQIISSAEPFFFPGNQIGCLLVHGFTGAPKEMLTMGEYLNAQGFTVLGVRLAGHATHPEDMIRSTYIDWLASVEDGFQLLSGAVERIYILGLSMGGALSLTTAAYLPVKGVVAMATPYNLPDDWRLNYTEIISKVVPYMPKQKSPPGAGWVDPTAKEGHVSYPQNPIRSLGQLKKLLDELHTILPQVKIPVLLMHSHQDSYVLPENMPAIYHDLGSPDKEMLWIENSGHVLTRDAQRETVYKAAVDFIRKLEAQSHAP